MMLTHQTSLAPPLSSGDPLHDWHTPSLWQQTKCALVVESLTQTAQQQEVSDTGRTDDMCGDACLREQRRNLLLVDVFALSLPTIRIDVDQQVFGSAGCKQQQ